jgi:thymidylate synthase
MGFQIYADTVNRTLSLMWTQRSIDLFLGLAFNIASYAVLTHMLAQVTGYRPGEVIGSLGNVHIYRNHFDAVREQLARDPKPLPTLWLNPDVKDIEGFTMDDVRMENYEHHPTIKAPMAV